MAYLHGTESSLALGWLTDRDQTARFEALIEIADLSNKTILDAGCGYADLFAFIAQRQHLAHYYGVEQIPELLSEARKRCEPLSNVTLIEGDFITSALPQVDYVMASGSLNYGSTDPGFIFKAIAILYEHCKLGMAFNLLSQIPQNGLIVAYDPELILTHCRSLSSKVIFKEGYANDDFTVWMYR